MAEEIRVSNATVLRVMGCSAVAAPHRGGTFNYPRTNGSVENVTDCGGAISTIHPVRSSGMVRSEKSQDSRLDRNPNG